MADDALTALLKRAKLTDPQRAGLWDLYSVAKDESDLAARLQSMDLPKELKAELWDLKSGVMADEVVEENATPTVSEGYWEDRGIGGKVWHQASGVKERNRADNQILGVPPELAAIGALRVGGAVAAPAVNAASRVASGAVEAARQAMPFVKFEAAREGLKYLGVPEPLATVGGVLAGGYRRGGAAKEVAPAAESAVTAETTPLGLPKPTQPAETPLEFSRRLKAEYQAKTGRTRLEAPAQPAARSPLKVDPQEFATEFKKLAKTPKLTAEEMSIGAKLLQSGMKAEDVLEKLLKRREFPSSWLTLPTDADIAGTIGARNATGKWPQP